MASLPVLVTITSRNENGCRYLQRSHFRTSVEASVKFSMLEQVKMAIMTNRYIEQLFPYWYARRCNSPTRTENIHGPTNYSLLSTISSNSLIDKSFRHQAEENPPYHVKLIRYGLFVCQKFVKGENMNLHMIQNSVAINISMKTTFLEVKLRETKLLFHRIQ
jgi:hypothetical protein